MGLFYDYPEIIPATSKTGHFFFDLHRNRAVSAAEVPPKQYVRAIVESQFLSMRIHAGKSGMNRIQRLLVTGGASKNEAIVQVCGY